MCHTNSDSLIIFIIDLKVNVAFKMPCSRTYLQFLQISDIILFMDHNATPFSFAVY